MINAWKKQAVEGMATVFCGKAQAADAGRKSEIDPLHAKIANWWWNGFFASDLRSPNVGARCDDQTGSPQLPITRQGKAPKTILIVVARQLLVIINAMTRKGQQIVLA